ncbi:hypothetical protein LTR56_000776 [Elasticomyces elasticus]|nr:hypothetical protein LTR22_009068 [Elasticomyces elasticus]KAK3660400.1 hypothetical protein LTR56_000776 [Elasticomyces elasticus]KAK4929209.1 hypothetical protein LTR49_004106 [Elasticomyces elasticus]KAK5765765.1 hypothetical protein LTS12_004025 [Elasticomyces elasticus]
MKRSVSKRPLTEVDPNIDREGAATKRLKAVLDRKRDEKNKLALDAMKPNAYLCISRPYWDFRDEHTTSLQRPNTRRSASGMRTRQSDLPEVLQKLWVEEENSAGRSGKPAVDFPKL